MGGLQVTDWETRLYPSINQRDPAQLFTEWVEMNARESDRVLDLGAGAGDRNRYDLRGRCREVVGADMDERVHSNPLVDRGITLPPQGDRIPVEDGAFDIVFTIYVLEHVEHPDAFAQEVSRVLKPGGLFMSLAPNRNHYVPMLARMTPTRFHEWANERRGRSREDTFPTYYRLNTTRAIRKTFEGAGLIEKHVRSVECCPNYLKFSLPAFWAGVLYERAVNAWQALDGLRVNILAAFAKPGDEAGAGGREPTMHPMLLHDSS